MILYCDIDEEGNIKNNIKGNRVIPERKYDDYFMITEEEYGELPEDVVENLDQYQVVNRQLVKKDPDKTIAEVIEELIRIE